MRAQYKSKSNSENKESSNARALTTISCEKSSHPTDWHGLSMFPNITRPGTGHEKAKSHIRRTFSYPEPFLRAVNGARQGALAKSISNWHLIGYNEGYWSNNVYILLPCFYGIRFWIWPEPLVAPRVRRALGTRMIRRTDMDWVILVPRALLTRGATRGSGQIQNRKPWKHGKRYIRY